jgi:hypothetical protein
MRRIGEYGEASDCTLITTAVAAFNQSHSIVLDLS